MWVKRAWRGGRDYDQTVEVGARGVGGSVLQNWRREQQVPEMRFG